MTSARPRPARSDAGLRGGDALEDASPSVANFASASARWACKAPTEYRKEEHDGKVRTLGLADDHPQEQTCQGLPGERLHRTHTQAAQLDQEPHQLHNTSGRKLKRHLSGQAPDQRPVLPAKLGQNALHRLQTLPPTLAQPLFHTGSALLRSSRSCDLSTDPAAEAG